VQQLDVHIALEGIPTGTYTVRETVLNRKSGSDFDQWLEMGALEPDSSQELAVLEAHSIPKCSKYLAEAKNHTLELDAMLDMLEVRLITIDQ
jgi:xylan 1,4-beta-xylosidase